VFWGAFTLGRLCGVFTSQKFTSLQLIFTNSTFILLATIFMVLFPQSIIVVWVTVGVFGFFMASQYASAYANAATLTEIPGLVISIFTVGCGTGDSLYPAIAARMFDDISIGASVLPKVLLILSSIQFALCIILMIISHKFTKKIEKVNSEETELIDRKKVQQTVYNVQPEALDHQIDFYWAHREPTEHH